MQHRFFKIIKDKSGASFMFVLGAMLLLMAIGVSTLVAASANSGFAIRQKAHSQIILLTDSIHNNIMYSLQKDTSDEDLLSAQLVMAIYEAAGDPAEISRLKDGVDLTMDIDGAGSDWNSGNVKMDSITLSFPKQEVIIRDAIDAITPEGGGLLPRESMTATVNATMIVTVIIEAKDQSITSRAFYKYMGGVLSDDPTGTGAAGAISFALDGENKPISGKWELIKRENVDTKD